MVNMKYLLYNNVFIHLFKRLYIRPFKLNN